jgi:hypothetical protein
MNKGRVIRCGQSSKKMAGISAETVACLEGFWSLEEQLGLRRKPEDDFLKHIPPIVRSNKGLPRG